VPLFSTYIFEIGMDYNGVSFYTNFHKIHPRALCIQVFMQSLDTPTIVTSVVTVL
jgi:hypothetical protein